MLKMYYDLLDKHSDKLFVAFRVLVGLLFVQHGAQKLFGMLGGQSAPLMSMFGLAGVIEFFGGLAIAVGLFTRLASTITALEMVAAYYLVHFRQSWFPILNGGEMAVLYFAAFLALMGSNNKTFSLENVLFKKKKK